MCGLAPVKRSREFTAEQQTAILVDRYSQRAEVYDAMWSPVIRPAGESLVRHIPLHGMRTIIDVGTGAGALLPAIQAVAPAATVVGIDRSPGMLRLARSKHSGPLALMDAQNLALLPSSSDVAVVAFVLFHLPHPDRCLEDINRVLKPGGVLGTVTWGLEQIPPANIVWDEELKAAGARVPELPATDNKASCDSAQKMEALLQQAGFGSIKVWVESIKHQWRPEDHFEYQVRSTSRLRLESLSASSRAACLGRVRHRLSGTNSDQYAYKADVVLATAVK